MEKIQLLFHYLCLQSSMVCVSSRGTTKSVYRLNEDHVVELQIWSDFLKYDLHVTME